VTARPATTAAYAGPPSIGRGGRLVSAVSSFAADTVADVSKASALGAGRLAAGSDTPPEVESWRLYFFPQADSAACGSTEPDAEPRRTTLPCLTQGPFSSCSQPNPPQLPENSWGELKRGNSLHKGQFPVFQHSANSRGMVLFNYYSLLPTEEPEKQQQTGLLLGRSEYSDNST
jgi:hypothetical protein